MGVHDPNFLRVSPVYVGKSRKKGLLRRVFGALFISNVHWSIRFLSFLLLTAFIGFSVSESIRISSKASVGDYYGVFREIFKSQDKAEEVVLEEEVVTPEESILSKVSNKAKVVSSQAFLAVKPGKHALLKRLEEEFQKPITHWFFAINSKVVISRFPYSSCYLDGERCSIVTPIVDVEFSSFFSKSAQDYCEDLSVSHTHPSQSLSFRVASYEEVEKYALNARLEYPGFKEYFYLTSTEEGGGYKVYHPDDSHRGFLLKEYPEGGGDIVDDGLSYQNMAFFCAADVNPHWNLLSR